MNKSRFNYILMVILSGFTVFTQQVIAADQSLEELLKKQLEAGAGVTTPAFVSPLVVPANTQSPKSEILKIPAAKVVGDEQATINVKEQASVLKEPVGLSPIEKLITADETLEAGRVNDINPAKTLAQFGYSFFKHSTFAPLTDVPVNADYMVGPGDTLVLTLWGSVEGTYELPVTRTGEVFLPKGGPVKVSGAVFGKLREIFRSRLAKEYRDFDLTVNMGKLRTVKVFVVGEVAAPGDYTISSVSTLINALSAAGGPTKNGSLRNIKLRHVGGSEETIDLYNFFTKGDKSSDIRLNSGDTVFVPVIGRIAAISGSVKRPAIYELRDEKTLKELLALAEGVTATGYLQHVQVSRVVANDRKQVLDLNLDSAGSGKSIDMLTAEVPIQDLDIVHFFPINNLLREHVRLEGHTDRPGFYSLQSGMRISGVVNKDRLLPEYFPDFIELTRLVLPDLVPQKIVVSLKGVLNHDQSQDIELKEFDSIRIFSRNELERQSKVKVFGEIQRPGEYRLYRDMTIRDLLIQAGYPTPSAYLANAELSRLRQESDKVSTNLITINLAEVMKGNPQANIKLEPFDKLSIKKIPDWSEENERTVTIAGEVLFPGIYHIYRDEPLSSVIKRAGGFTSKAYLPGAKFTRETLRQQQQKHMDSALARAEEEVIRKQAQLSATATSKEELEATKSALEGLRRNIELLKSKRAEGRLLIQLSSVEDIMRGTSDMELKGGDSLNIPANPNSVNVLGQVYNPASVIYTPSESTGFYLKKVGGPTDNAEESEMYLVKMDGTVISRKQSTFLLFFDGFESKTVNSGDTIVVPQRFEKVAWIRELKDISTILGQVALTAGVLIAAGL